MCHTRELAFQISKEYERFSKFLPNLKASICCQPSQCRKEFWDPDPGRQELDTKNEITRIFVVKSTKTFKCYDLNFILEVKSSLLVIGNLGVWMRIRNSDRNQHRSTKNYLFVRLFSGAFYKAN
jgi:hypothetical protein